MKWKAACVFLALLAAGLAVLAYFQWRELHRGDIHLDWGNVPTWLSAAISLLVVVGLVIAAYELKLNRDNFQALEAERQSQEQERREQAAERRALEDERRDLRKEREEERRDTKAERYSQEQERREQAAERRALESERQAQQREREEERRALEAERQSQEQERREQSAERRALEAERRELRKARQMSQARLIVAEPVDDGMSILQGAIAADFDDADVSIANHSTEPVFDLRIVNALGSGVVVQQQFADGPNAPTALPVLAAGQNTEPLTVAGSGSERTCEVIEFAFTDARGMRWHRRGNDMPRNFVLPDDLP